MEIYKFGILMLRIVELISFAHCFRVSGTYFTAYDGVQDTQFPTPVVENVQLTWKPVSYGHPLKDATMFYAPPSLERVVISGGLEVRPGNNIDRIDRGNLILLH